MEQWKYRCLAVCPRALVLCTAVGVRTEISASGCCFSDQDLLQIAMISWRRTEAENGGGGMNELLRDRKGRRRRW